MLTSIRAAFSPYSAIAISETTSGYLHVSEPRLHTTRGKKQNDIKGHRLEVEEMFPWTLRTDFHLGYLGHVESDGLNSMDRSRIADDEIAREEASSRSSPDPQRPEDP
jgi:hypothetical protein